MADSGWSRADKIGVVSVLIAIVACVAALAVVPELRQWVGLKNGDAQPSTSVNESNPPSRKEVPPVETTPSRDKPQREVNKIWLGLNERGETPRAESECCLLEEDVKSGVIAPREGKVQLIDLSVYDNKHIYLKLSVCNSDYRIARLDKLFVWYTSGVQESVNWEFSNGDEPLLRLKPGECRIVGGWSDQVKESFRLMRPLGQLFYSDNERYGSDSIDLGQLDWQGFVKIK